MLGYLGLMVDLEEKDERNRKEDQLDLSYTWPISSVKTGRDQSWQESLKSTRTSERVNSGRSYAYNGGDAS